MYWARWETKQPKASMSSSSGIASVNKRVLDSPSDIVRHSSFDADLRKKLYKYKCVGFDFTCNIKQIWPVSSVG